jgi:ABC-type multidrug transport system fused ATPase/permease subunit
MKYIKKQSAKNGVISGFFYGLSQLVIFTTVPLMFYISSLFVQNNGVSIDDMFTGIFALFFAAMTIGNNSHMMPDMAECRIAAGKLFLLLDSQD